jgi:hypothetical protein
VNDVAIDLIKREITADRSFRRFVHGRVMDAVRGQAGARAWIAGEGGLLVLAFGRYLDEGGKVR